MVWIEPIQFAPPELPRGVTCKEQVVRVERGEQKSGIRQDYTTTQRRHSPTPLLRWTSGRFEREQGTDSAQQVCCVDRFSILKTMVSVAAEVLIKADGQYQGVAVAGGALVLVVALYLLAEKYQTTRVQKHWQDVCRKTLQRRNSLEHKVLRSDEDTHKVRVKHWASPGLCDAPPMFGLGSSCLIEGVRTCRGRCWGVHAGRCTQIQNVCPLGELRMWQHRVGEALCRTNGGLRPYGRLRHSSKLWPSRGPCFVFG